MGTICTAMFIAILLLTASAYAFFDKTPPYESSAPLAPIVRRAWKAYVKLVRTKDTEEQVRERQAI